MIHNWSHYFSLHKIPSGFLLNKVQLTPQTSPHLIWDVVAADLHVLQQSRARLCDSRVLPVAPLTRPPLLQQVWFFCVFLWCNRLSFAIGQRLLSTPYHCFSFSSWGIKVVWFPTESLYACYSHHHVSCPVSNRGVIVSFETVYDDDYKSLTNKSIVLWWWYADLFYFFTIFACFSQLN